MRTSLQKGPLIGEGTAPHVDQASVVDNRGCLSPRQWSDIRHLALIRNSQNLIQNKVPNHKSAFCNILSKYNCKCLESKGLVKIKIVSGIFRPSIESFSRNLGRLPSYGHETLRVHDFNHAQEPCQLLAGPSRSPTVSSPTIFKTCSK